MRRISKPNDTSSKLFRTWYPVLLCCTLLVNSSRGLVTSSSSMRTNSFATSNRARSSLIMTNSNEGRQLWEEHWSQIVQMRGKVEAAVDTMGAEALAKRGAPEGNAFRFQTLIGTMLSPQTKDAQTSQGFNNLVELVHPSPLLPSSLAECSVESIEQAIKMTSFYSVKARNILEAAKKCRDEYGDDIPRGIDDLLSFKGVGPKVGYLTFTIAWGENLGICVDTHVHRISNRLDWVTTWQAKSNGPEKTRKELQKFLPQSKWGDVNFLLVGFGQTICRAVKPKCEQCTIQNKCKYFNDLSYMR